MALTEREIRRQEAKQMCLEYLYNKDVKMSYCPHTEFAIANEEAEHLPQ